jgi:uncharacterized protein YdeI (YjbR/CyaY-like superfamily)
MPTFDPRLDAYIAAAAPFAQPILGRLRELVHRGCPGVVETLKWSSPAFDFHGPLAHMAAFKAHCVFGFWKGELVTGSAGEPGAMGQLGRLRTLADLPSEEILVAWIEKAAELNASGVKAPRPTKHAKPELAVPDDLAAELARRVHAKARATFESLPPGHRREYLEWILEAKRPETRAKRLATTLEWLAEGKSRNWRYERK